MAATNQDVTQTADELAPNATNGTVTKSKVTLLAPAELDKMVAESLRDVSDDDEDTNIAADADLLRELQTIANGGDVDKPQQLQATNNVAAEQLFLPTTTLNVINIIRQRIDIYKAAETHAETANESAKARRYARGLKTLNDLLEQARAGKVVNVEDIPPEVFVKDDEEVTTPINVINTPFPTTATTANVPTRTAPAPPSSAPSTAANILIEQMKSRRLEYEVAALNSKRNGDESTAQQFLQVVKKFDVVMQMCAEGKEADLSDMPPAPEKYFEFMAKLQTNAAKPTSP